MSTCVLKGYYNFFTLLNYIFGVFYHPSINQLLNVNMILRLHLLWLSVIKPLLANFYRTFQKEIQITKRKLTKIQNQILGHEDSVNKIQLKKQNQIIKIHKNYHEIRKKYKQRRMGSLLV